MKINFTRISFREHYSILKQLLRWTVLVLPTSIAIGSAVAFFLWLLNGAIHFRFHHDWLLYLLPVAGLLIYFIYQTVGKSAEKGNNLVFEQIQNKGGNVPKRMAPIILITTVVTHLFGGSAGREGTAVQMGSSIAGMFGSLFRVKGIDLRMLLTAGVAAGFGAVFGTPLTGAIFALEVLTIGRIPYEALLPALLASFIGDATVAAWKVQHMHYQIDDLQQSPLVQSSLFHIDLLLLVKVIVASACFGLASLMFASLLHEVKSFCQYFFKQKWMIPVVGGLVIIGLTVVMGKPDYLSLGVDAEYPAAITIPSAFHEGGADSWSWFWKTIYTTVTLGTGFKGGEVTPLFYIGATLGNTLSGLLNAPVSLFAALGFIAVFSGATNTPFACTFMGIELFGGEHTLLFAVACFTAYFFSGHSSIYSSEASLSANMKRKGYLYQKLSKYTSSFKKEN